jgi:hypothetical protein
MNRPITLRTLLLSNGLLIVLVVTLLFGTPHVQALRETLDASTSTATIAYQGRLAKTDGTLITGKTPMTFSIYKEPTGGTALWTETYKDSRAVAVNNGQFSVMLGSQTPIPQTIVDGTDTLYLGVAVDGDDEMNPRLLLGSAPYAFQALTVPDGSITTAKLANGAVDGSKFNEYRYALLGHKTCGVEVTEAAVIRPDNTAWMPIKCDTKDEIVEVSLTTHGGPVVVEIIGYMETDPPGNHFYAAEVLNKDGNLVAFGHIIGGDRIKGEGDKDLDSAGSGSWLIPELSAGTYTFRLIGHTGFVNTVTWRFLRQIAVYEFLPPNTP